MDPTDWFSSDAAVERLFASLQGRAREAAAAAVNGAADAAEDRLPGLSNSARLELDRTIALARVRASQAVDAEKAHAIRILAEVSPQLRAELSAIARDAGVSATGGAMDEFDRRAAAYRAPSWAVALAAAAGLAAAVAIAASIAQAANARDAAGGAR